MTNEVLSEKVSVNINTATLSNIDILVDNGYYSNRSDFINQALRESLRRHQSTLDRIIDDKTRKNSGSSEDWYIGVTSLGAQDIKEMKKYRDKTDLVCYGILRFENDIDPKVLFEAVRSIRVKGKILCSPEIKKHYGLK